MIIIGIDPGTASTGYGVVKRLKAKTEKNKNGFKFIACGVIRTLPSSPQAERLKKINNDLNKLIKKHKVEALAMESLYFFKNLKTAIPVSQAGGVILLTAAKNKLPIYQFTPLQVKSFVTGFGRSEKQIVQEKIKILLKLKETPKPDDAADALAVALAFCLKRKEGLTKF